jgi:hypothetical protein
MISDTEVKIKGVQSLTKSLGREVHRPDSERAIRLYKMAKNIMER